MQQSWNPAALLQPGRRQPNNSRLGTPSSNPASPHPFMQRERADSESSNGNAIFQFATTTDSASDIPSGPSTPGSVTPVSSGLGSWIERVNNVQARSAIPHPKRRKVDELGQDGNTTSIPTRNGGGGLGDYVRDQQQQADGTVGTQAMMVDLTAGKQSSR